MSTDAGNRIKVDNTAAIVLATGEGSWRTKSAANKVYAVKEKVDCGKLMISYVGTKDQCADSLTKFLRGGQDQLKARVHLSLLNLENWLPGRGSHTKACGVKNFSDPTGSFGPRVCRVFLSEPEVSSSEVSGPGGFHCFGPDSLAQGKKTSVSQVKEC